MYINKFQEMLYILIAIYIFRNSIKYFHDRDKHQIVINSKKEEMEE